MTEYVVIYEQAEDGGWGAYLPDLPGVVALGATRDEVAAGIKEALAAYTDDLQQRGGTLPAPHHIAGTVAAQRPRRLPRSRSNREGRHLSRRVSRSRESRLAMRDRATRPALHSAKLWVFSESVTA